MSTPEELDAESGPPRFPDSYSTMKEWWSKQALPYIREQDSTIADLRSKLRRAQSPKSLLEHLKEWWNSK